MKRLLTYLWLIVNLSAFSALASPLEDVAKLPLGFEECSSVFFNDKPMRRAQDGEVELCYSHMAVLYDTTAKHAVYSVAYIDANQLAQSQARNLNRKHLEFFTDPRIRSSAQARNSDYAKSGWDRGHLIANSSSTSKAMQEQSFALTQVCPQDPHTNRKGGWVVLEKSFRAYLQRSGKGAYFYAGCFGSQGQIGSGVNIPSHFWMLVVPSSTKESWAFIVSNTPDSRIQTKLTQAQLEERLGYRLAR